MTKLFSVAIACLVFLLLASPVAAQQIFQSNEFVTRVGDPQGPPPNTSLPGSGEIVSDPSTGNNLSCPLQNTYISCGTYWNPVPFSGGTPCGHCRNDSTSSYGGGRAGEFGANGLPISNGGIWAGGSGTCRWAGTPWGIDIAGPDGSPVQLPTVKGENVTWKYYGPVGLSENGLEEIQGFTGTSPSGEKYYMQLHHTRPGSGNPNATKPGDRGANICVGCNEHHVHVQIATGDPNAAASNWIDPLSKSSGKQLMCSSI